MPLSHRFAVPVLHIIVGGEQISLEHGVGVNGACIVTLVELLMLDVLEGLVASLWRAGLIPELIFVEREAIALVGSHEATGALVLVLVVDEGRIVGFACHGLSVPTLAT